MPEIEYEILIDGSVTSSLFDFFQFIWTLVRYLDLDLVDNNSSEIRPSRRSIKHKTNFKFSYLYF